MSSNLSLDPTATDPREVAHIIPSKFWIRYVSKQPKDASGKEVDGAEPYIVPVEMVEWAKKGQHLVTGQKTTMRISQAKKNKQVWAALGAYYDSWKNNQEAPIDGTPLGAWPGITPEQAEQLRMLRVRTVEDVAAMNDADIERYGMGGLNLRQQARAFMEAKKDRTHIAAEVATQMAGMQAIIEGLQAKLAAQEPGPSTPRRGRPPKQEAA